MEISKLKKYLRIYLDTMVTPKVNKEFASQEDYEPITISIYDIKPKENLPEELNVFLDIDPNLPNGYYVKNINGDIKDFLKMLGVSKLISIQWNKRPLY